MKSLSCAFAVIYLVFGAVAVWSQDIRKLPFITGPNLGKNKNLVFSLPRHPPLLLKERKAKPKKKSRPKETRPLFINPSRDLPVKLAKLIKLEKPEKKEIIFPSAPKYYEGLYLNNYTLRNPLRYQNLIRQAQNRKMNVLVADVQPFFPQEKFFKEAKKKKFYLAARIVVFPGGLKSYPPDPHRLQKIYALIEKSAQKGFHEIQLDYIRFADTKNWDGLTLKKRYACIEQVLKKVDQKLEPYAVFWSADLFGRVAFNHEDRIGQKLELFSLYADLIYPMLYPSHFYGVPQKIRDPYEAVLSGIKNSLSRVGKKTRIVAFIQAFKMNIAPSGLSFIDYIYKQIAAAEDAGAGGYVAWNARNDYKAFFSALDKYRSKNID